VTFRREEKVEIAPTAVPAFLAWAASVGGGIMFPPRRVVSIYLDNESLAMYHDSGEGVVPRRKVRLRSYQSTKGEMSIWRLETKISSVEGRFKTTLGAENMDLDDLRHLDDHYGSCRASVEVSYDRAYLWVRGCRVTVDTGLRYRKQRSTTLTGTENRNMSGPCQTDGAAVVEVKADYGWPEDVLLERFPWERSRFSKYCRAVELVVFGGDLAAE